MGATRYTKREIKLACEEMFMDRNEISGVLLALDKVVTETRKPKEAPHPLTAKIVEMYNDWYVLMMGIPPKITVQDGMMAKQVAKYMSDIVRAKDPTARDCDVVRAWQLILSKYPMNDKFYGTQLKLSQIGSNLNNLIALIKKSNGQQTGESSLRNIATIIADRNSGI